MPVRGKTNRKTCGALANPASDCSKPYYHRIRAGAKLLFPRGNTTNQDTTPFPTTEGRNGGRIGRRDKLSYLRGHCVAIRYVRKPGSKALRLSFLAVS